jgi:uncharacterized protein
MSTTATLQPVADGERLQTLDVLRGFALLGVFLMNIEWFSRPLLENGTGLDLSGGPLDDLAAWGVAWLVQGKFWALFSLLFGMGFSVMSMRAEAAGRGFYGPYLRRVLALGAFGAAHAIALWPGDILFSYAVTALVLLGLRAFQRAAMPTAPLGLRWMAGGGIWVCMAGLSLLFGLLMMMVPTPAGQGGGGALQALVDEAPRVYAEGSYAEVTAFRLREWTVVAGFSLMGIVPMALALFLIGGWYIRSGVMRDPAAHRGLWRRHAWIGLPLGLGLAAFGLSIADGMSMTAPDGKGLVAMSIAFFASLALMLGYVGALTLATLSPRLGPWLQAWLAPAGRMALTNYLGQSLVASCVFYGYGLGVYGELGRGGQTLFVFAVFALQVVASRWWLARFRYGPMEWLWRAVTYLRLPPMRR